MPKSANPPDPGKNEGTTDVGLFNFADAYVLCAKSLIDSRPKGLRFDDPVCFLVYHAIELYLKAALRNSGISVEVLAYDYGHDYAKLLGQASSIGLCLVPRIDSALRAAKEWDLQSRSRYIRTGGAVVLESEGLLAIASDVRRAVRTLLESKGVTLLATTALDAAPTVESYLAGRLGHSIESAAAELERLWDEGRADG